MRHLAKKGVELPIQTIIIFIIIVITFLVVIFFFTNSYSDGVNTFFGSDARNISRFRE